MITTWKDQDHFTYLLECFNFTWFIWDFQQGFPKARYLSYLVFHQQLPAQMRKLILQSGFWNCFVLLHSIPAFWDCLLPLRLWKVCPSTLDASCESFYGRCTVPQLLSQLGMFVLKFRSEALFWIDPFLILVNWFVLLLHCVIFAHRQLTFQNWLDLFTLLWVGSGYYDFYGSSYYLKLEISY